MNTFTSKSLRPLHAAALATVLALAGCGGSDDDGPTAGGAQNPPPAATVDLVAGTGVPTSATTSVAGVLAFLSSLIGNTSETSEPIAVGNAMLSTSETDEATPQ